MKITLASGRALRASRTQPGPSRPGMITSESMMSTCSAASFRISSASSPEAASTTV